MGVDWAQRRHCHSWQRVYAWQRGSRLPKNLRKKTILLKCPIRGAAAAHSGLRLRRDGLVIDAPVGLILHTGLIKLHICVLIGCRVGQGVCRTYWLRSRCSPRTRTPKKMCLRGDGGTPVQQAVILSHSAFLQGRDRPHWPDLTPLSPEILLIPYLGMANCRPSVY